MPRAAGYFDAFLDMWVTGGENNDAQWSNAEYDALIAQGKSSTLLTLKLMNLKGITFRHTFRLMVLCVIKILILPIGADNIRLIIVSHQKQKIGPPMRNTQIVGEGSLLAQN